MPHPGRSSRRILVTLFTLAAPVVVLGQDSLNPFSADDVFELEYANSPQVSPDGSRIVYERRSNDIMTDRTRSNLWIINSDGSRHRPIVSGATQATSPQWSPSGDRIAWVQSVEEGTDIMVRWMDGGQTARVVNLRSGPSSLSWSPDGRWIAFEMSVKADREPLAKVRKGPEGSEWSEPVKVFDKVRYKRDGEGFVEEAYEHIFVVPADGGTPRQLTSGDFNHGGDLAWAADGSRIYFSANRDDDWEYQTVESDLYSVTVSDGTISQITDRAGGESQPALSPDGRWLAYRYDDGRKVAYRNKRLHVLNLETGEDRALTDTLDASVTGFDWADNSRSVYFHYDGRGQRIAASASLSGDINVLTSNLGGTSVGRPYVSGSFSEAGGVVAFTHGTAGRLAEVATVRRGRETVLTALSEDLLGNRDLGEVHEIVYTSSYDDTEIQGWYITPPGYVEGQAYPTILEIHGGPHLAYAPQFAAELQRYAADGYVVFYDNHRGSTGYGEEFALKLHYMYSSEADFADHLSGVDALIERGIADPEQLYITGGSAGGIASAYAIGLTDRFVAAAVQKPVINWVSKVLTADSYIGQTAYQFPGMPWEELDHYWKRSPLSLVGNVVTPTMLITGEEDQRTPISETEQFYQALKLRRVDSIMVRVPGSSHGIAGRPSRLNAKVDNILAWFARYRDPDADE